MKKPSEIDIHWENWSVSVISGQGESLAGVTPHQQRIPCKNKIKKTPASLVLRKEPIGNTVNPRKISQEGTVIDPEKKVVNIKYLELFK